jgi:dTDP-4-amino-4,6-dideoxygalactose transaminase
MWNQKFPARDLWWKDVRGESDAAVYTAVRSTSRALPNCHAWKTLISSNGGADETLASSATWLGVRNVFGVSSGRAALTVILRSLHRLRPDSDVVALPAYTCITVPASVRD